ncbi:GNAT family N-acetyltransferase [Lysinibacillus sp. SGAir0095]|uniref:GNAT family N-acetyltransferase n=1 Tax=Lysinibacillus sp. SGAir0095 TaxID=2070463 RepID=UPI0010CCDB0A|nr:GNAT family N-acetyltransferase [Lysinibacillus sp. SGAir0095]QCR32723.1 GNAT family N-acetyltransferase [Lysinibacillus sp. SGAir0095]
MQIRTIELRDTRNYLDLNKKIDESGFMLYEPGEKQITFEQQEKFIERVLADHRSTMLVAEVDAQLAGFIAAIGNNLERTKHRASIVIGLLEEFRGQGIGKSLFEQIFMWAKEANITRLELTVIKENQRAFNLYRKMGFVLEGEKVHSLMINGKPMNEYYLYKLLEH